MKHFRILLIVLLITLTITFSSFAQGQKQSPLADLEWIRLGGPPGGIGYDIRMDKNDPTIMYVTDANAGIHKSVDRGKTWFPTNEGVGTRTGSTGDLIPVFCVTIDPNNSDNIWIGMVDNGGVFYSENAGETWENRINGITEEFQLTIRGITIQPGNSDVVYIGAEIGNEHFGGLPGMVQGVIYKSIDRGLNWRAIWRGDNLVRYILIDPTDHNTLYASTGIFDRDAANSNRVTGEDGGIGIIKSTDAGETWRPINNGLNNLYFSSIDMHPENTQILIAAAEHVNWSHGDGWGLYMTSNGGEEWEYVIGNDVTAVEFSDEFPDYAYALGAGEFYRSFDGGNTWEDAGSSETGSWGLPRMVGGFPMDIEVDPEDPLKFFVNTYQGGNFYTDDGGDTWSVASVGYTGSSFTEILTHSDNQSIVYTIGRSGPFISLDGGIKWDPISMIGHYNEGSAIAVDPENMSSILAADYNSGCIIKSNNYGFSWEIKICFEDELNELSSQGGDQRFFAQGVSSIVYSPSNPDKVYAGFGVANCLETLYDGCSARAIASVLTSQDRGKSWETIDNPVFQDRTVMEIVVHPDHENIAWAAVTNVGVVKTEDGGETWMNISPQVRGELVTALTIDNGNPDRLFLGIFGEGVFRSDDGGITWSKKVAGVNPVENVRSIVIDPIRPNVVYMGAEHSGVFVSEDIGDSWRLINQGLTNRAVVDLGISSDGLTLYAVTDGGGAYRLSVHDQDFFIESAMSPSDSSLNNKPSDEPISSDSEISQGEDTISGIENTIKQSFQVDGIAEDWENHELFHRDNLNDAEATDIDFSDGYSFALERSLYFLVDIANESQLYTQIFIEFETGDTKYLLIWDKDLADGWFYDVTDQSNYQEIGSPVNSEISINSYLEGIIDLSDISISDSISKLSYIEVWTGSEDDGTWRNADKWAPDKSPYTYDESLLISDEIEADDLNDEASISTTQSVSTEDFSTQVTEISDSARTNKSIKPLHIIIISMVGLLILIAILVIRKRK